MEYDQDLYFRLANYVTVSEMFLKKSRLGNEDLELKDYYAGHWGTSPAINFIYSHIYLLEEKYQIKTQVIIGTGHSGVALLANLWLRGELDDYPYSLDDFNKLIQNFGAKNGFRTEVNPHYPTTIYDGGELGYSLAVAFGYVYRNPDNFVICIVGDGEMETGTLSSSWMLNKKKTDQDGKVLPIINLNSYKMTDRTLISTLTEAEQINYFRSMGYIPHVVNENSKKMSEALEKSYLELENGQSPVIILKTRKGWTGPSFCEGKISSHKNPLANIPRNQHLEIVKSWLDSYQITELPPMFSKKRSSHAAEVKKQKLNIKKYQIEEKQFSNISALEPLLFDYEINVLSPDEIVSNKLGRLTSSNHLFEILNENICQAMLQGIVMQDKRGVMISYEAFMPIVSSMVSQYMKYIYQKRKTKRRMLPALNYILTSTCWENNYSHQNPEFVGHLLGKEYDFVNIYYPKDANNALNCFKKIYDTYDAINVITLSKMTLPQYQTLDKTNSEIEIFVDCESPDITIAVSGDIMLEKAIKIKKQYPTKKIRIVYVTNICLLGSPKQYSKALTDTEFAKYFSKDSKNIYLFHGYPSVIRNLLYNRNIKFDIYGYEDKSDIAGSIDEKIDCNIKIDWS